ncbi:pirin family protein [Halomonas shantousis]
MSQRIVTRVIPGHPSQDGAGVKIHRIHDFGGGIDPFLMLDELGSDRPDEYLSGFPSHPHRGIQTLTYVIHGGLTHEDHLGHSSTIRAGDAQWMHTGRGIVHSEMPLADSDGLHAFQLWLNLPARDKLSPPTYRDVQGAEMPQITVEGGRLIALGGDWHLGEQHVSGPLDRLAGHGAIADVRLSAGSRLQLTQEAETLLVYCYKGKLAIEGREVSQGTLAIMGSGDALSLLSDTESGALLLAGTPHREPIAHYGPFVMNSREELEQTLRDYQDGTLMQ